MLWSIEVTGTEDGLGTIFEYSVHGNPFDMSVNLRFEPNQRSGYTYEQVCMIIDWVGLRKWLTVQSITMKPFSENKSAPH